jgi:hypothetical protein
MQIGRITSDNVTLWIWSSPIKVLLEVGQKKQIDLDGNNLAELEISLSKIENGKAFLFLKEIEETEETMPPSIPPMPEEAYPQQEIAKKSLWILLVIMACVILITVISLVLKKKARKKEKKLSIAFFPSYCVY